MDNTFNQIMEKLKGILEELSVVETKIQSIKDYLNHTEENIEKIKEGTFEGLHYVNAKVNELDRQIKEINLKVDKLLEQKK
jgi:chromosome segregation ATPase